MEPYAVGTHVTYRGSKLDYHGVIYEITAHYPINRFRPELAVHYGQEFVDEKYPDGTGYELWPVGAKRKMDNDYLSLNSVRRESITPVEDDAQDS